MPDVQLTRTEFERCSRFFDPALPRTGAIKLIIDTAGWL
jgi:hypothetical protein